MATTPPNQFSQAEVAGALSSYYGVASTDSGLVRLLGIVAPDIQALAANNPNWKAAIPGVIAKYASVAEQFGLGVSATQRDAQVLNRANITDATYAATLGRLENALGLGAARLIAGQNGERRSSADYTHAFNGGPYNANNLSDAMRAYVGYSNFTASDVARAANFVRGLGINADLYSGYFLGTSDVFRQAIQDHIKNGTKLTNDHIANPNDVAGYIATINSGVVKKENAPSAIRKIIDDMKAKGIETDKVDAKVIHQYFKDKPKALEDAKKANAATLNQVSNKTDEQLKAEKLDQKVDVAPIQAQTNVQSQQPKKIDPKINSARL